MEMNSYLKEETAVPNKVQNPKSMKMPCVKLLFHVRVAYFFPYTEGEFRVKSKGKLTDQLEM